MFLWSDKKLVSKFRAFPIYFVIEFEKMLIWSVFVKRLLYNVQVVLIPARVEYFFCVKACELMR